jgi:hypothetical protein
MDTHSRNAALFLFDPWWALTVLTEWIDVNGWKVVASDSVAATTAPASTTMPWLNSGNYILGENMKAN